MPILVEGCYFSGGGIGISAPSDADLIVKSTQFLGLAKSIDIYDPKAVALFGLPADVPNEQLAALVAKLKERPDATDQEIAETVAGSGLSKWLGNADLLLKVTTGFVALVRTGFEIFK
ncbi:hypothetical protein HX793_30445 [Pseudomonas reactans]|uniref:hypothetical protein n=1 Tax=Pseudomonas reactans TaxID=117680 RepID=UPI0015BF61AB|nr:hypothetical protein [Pseudomonas reactans]NWD34123.1 hypothetical protein [Pseudomonas reactans]